MESIKFQVNIKKVLEAVLYVATHCSGIGFHSICKLFFYADVYHISKYGRPVLGDEYQALQYGPVPRTTYSLLKQDPLLLEALDEEQPFAVVRKGSKPIVVPLREAHIEYFSKSDIEALDYAIEHFSKMSFSELTELSHQHPAWQKVQMFNTMNYEDFIDPSNRELIQDLQENSRYISI